MSANSSRELTELSVQVTADIPPQAAGLTSGNKAGLYQDTGINKTHKTEDVVSLPCENWWHSFEALRLRSQH